MYQKIMLTLLVLISIQGAKAQNNPIFFGGFGDGMSTANYIQSSNQASSLGGFGHGFSTSNYVQSSISAASKGGNGDGFSSTNYIQSSNDVAFLGGAGQGWITQNYIQARNNPEFLGGNGQGWITTNYEQTRTNPEFLGGDGQGWITNYYEQTRANPEFFGGVGDGWASIYYPLGPLPVELLSFTGHYEGTGHLLKWATSAEINSSHFVIEHSVDALTFLELGMRDAAGESSTKMEYNFTNAKPTKGNNFYRLKMVDKDGKYKYSNVVLLKSIGNNAGIVLYPNPSASIINIDVNGELDNSMVAMQIIDMTGKTVWKNDEQKNKNTYQIDVAHLATGMYQLIIVYKEERSVLKFKKL